MKKVERSEILALQEYEEQRPLIRRKAMSEKNRRRVHLGDHLTFLFENRDTVRYQVQEMLRIEKRDTEADVAHELDTYNELLGADGELGCTLLIEIDDASERDLLLSTWLDLPRCLYLVLNDGSRAPAQFDERQVGDGRLSSVQYLKFDCGAATPLAIGSTMTGYELETELTPVQKKALAEDLGRS